MSLRHDVSLICIYKMLQFCHMRRNLITNVNMLNLYLNANAHLRQPPHVGNDTGITMHGHVPCTKHCAWV